MDALATVADLQARSIEIDPPLVDALLASASASIRDAAGVPISKETSQIAIEGTLSCYLELPGGPVREVLAVSLDGQPVNDWKLVSGRLWRASGWQPTHMPALVEIEYTHGLDQVPADIVDLCCSLVGAGAASAADAYDPHRSLTSERIDDYARTFTRGDEEVVTPMELPASTRQWLRQRFSTGAAVTGFYE